MARSFDVITDPVMAWVSDQTRGRMGRRRPYILLGAPFYALFIVLLFSPPRGLTGIDASHPTLPPSPPSCPREANPHPSC